MTKYILNYDNGTENRTYESDTIYKLSIVSGISISSLYRIKLNPNKYLLTDPRKKKHKGYSIIYVVTPRILKPKIIKPPKIKKISDKKSNEVKQVEQPIVRINMVDKLILSFD